MCPLTNNCAKNDQLECNDNESGGGSPRLLSGGEQSWLVLVINIIWE